MATDDRLFSISQIAGADLSNSQYYFVERSAAGTVTVCNAAADVAYGVLVNKPKANEAATVVVLGICSVVSDGSGTAIVDGDFIGPNASGKAVKKATADYGINGIALDPSTANGTVIRVLLLGPSLFRTRLG